MGKTRRNQAGYRPKSGVGKGDSPRNMGPKFRENYDSIFRKPKPQPKPPKPEEE